MSIGYPVGFERQLGGGTSSAAPEIAAVDYRNQRKMSLRFCYQTCYHFLQEPARNRMNQEATRWIMSLKYKEQDELR